MPSAFVVGATHARVTLPLSSGAATLMLKGVSEADAGPAFTLIMMLAKVPTFELDGVPLNVPVALLKVAQVGRF